MKKPPPIDLSQLKTNGLLGNDEYLKEHLGDYLIRKKIINSEILFYALKRQQETNKLLGQLLVEENYISPEILREYTLNRLFNPNRSESLALLMLKAGKIDEKKLRELKVRQKLSGRALGAIMVDEGIINPQDFTQEKFIELWRIGSS